MSIDSKYGIGRVLLLVLCGMLVQGCSAELSPLYRDYLDEKNSDDLESVRVIGEALEQAGWTLTESPTATIIMTEPRQFQEWGLYRIEVSLDVAPMADEVVRILFHPYRIYFTGGRSKIQYLSPRLRRQVLKDLNKSFDEAGLVAVDTPIKRDRDKTGQK